MAFLNYLAQAGIYSAVMWGIYVAVLRNKPLHSGGRIYLLGSLVLPLLLPLVRVPVGSQSPVLRYQAVLPELVVGSQRTHVQHVAGFPWLTLCLWAYATVAIIIALGYLSAYIRVLARLRQGQVVRYEGYSITTGAGIGPGTFGRRIFFPAREVDAAILRHELAHIGAGHRYDAALLQLVHIVFWASPAHWLIGRELKMLHEFEADRLACAGEESAYGTLLLAQSLDSHSSFLIGHSFSHHPLKRRIMMLQKLKARGRIVSLIPALILTAGFMSAVLVAQSRKTAKPGTVFQQDSTIIDMDVVMRNAQRLPKIGEIQALQDGAIVFKTVEQMPKFNGNMYDWVAKHIRYTDADRAHGLKGRSVVQFTVSENGTLIQPRLLESSGHKALDNEALRLIGEMPPWKPGMHNGRPVGVLLTQSFYFDKEGDIIGGC